MALSEKLLNLIGIGRMSNRDVLLDEFAAISAEDFERIVLSHSSNLYETLELYRCADCKADHGGQCPNPEDDACPSSMAEWLDSPCRREHLIVEVCGDEEAAAEG